MDSGNFRPKKCCVPNCEDLYSKRHRFPRPDREIELFKVWVDKVKNPLLKVKTKEQIYKTYVICDVHFKDDFKVFSHRGLSRKAFPTLSLLESSDDNFEEYPPAKTAKRGDSVNEVTVEPEQGLELSVPIINPSERTSSSKLRQYDIHTQNVVNYSSSHASLIVGSPLKKYMKKTVIEALKLSSKKSPKRSRQEAIPSQKLHAESDEVMNSRTNKIGSEFFEQSMKDTNHQNEGPKYQMDDDDSIFFEPKVKEFENDNKFEVFYLDPIRKPSKYTVTDEVSESNEFDFVDNSFQEIDPELLDSQLQKPEKVSLEFQRLCRICLGTNSLTHLTKCESLVTLFVNVTNIEVEVVDNLPKYMCADCIQKLEGIASFINVAKKSNEKLKQNMLVKEDIKIGLSNNVNEELLSMADDISNMSQEVFNYDSADIESVKTELSTELDSKKPLGTEFSILNNDYLQKNESMMPLLKKDDRNYIENVKDFHNKSLEKQISTVFTSFGKDHHSVKKNDCICWKCGALYVGLRKPKAIEDVPPQRLKFYCRNCL